MDYSKITIPELKAICREKHIKGYSGKNKQELIEMIQQNEITPVSGSQIDPETDVKVALPINVEMALEVLTPCNLPKSVNIDILKNSIIQYMRPREEYYRDKNRAPFIEDELSEYYTAKATNGIEIGAGNCAMDVKTEDNEGIDAMCVIMNKNQSNEKSLVQNFSDSGANLDTLFKEKKDVKALNLFLNQYKNKLDDVKKIQNLTYMFILAFVSTDKEVYVVCFKINLENIKHVSSGGFVNKEKPSCVNIIVSNFINSSYGNVKLYKSKKRMELRLSPFILKSEYAIKLYSMS